VTKNEGWMLFVDTRLREPHQQQEYVVRTLKSGKEYIIYKRYFTVEELKNLLEQQLSRSFSTLELDSYVICVSPSRE
jgi:maltooligosyltrehalose synthase